MLEQNGVKEKINLLSKELQDAYGKRPNDKRVLMIAYKYNALPLSEFSRLTTHVVCASRYMPMPEDFDNAARELQMFRKNSAETTFCIYCNGSGLLSAYSKLAGDSYNPMFRCMCNNSRKCSEKIERFSQKAHGKEFQALYHPEAYKQKHDHLSQSQMSRQMDIDHEKLFPPDYSSSERKMSFSLSPLFLKRTNIDMRDLHR